jgi:hypothetical protein
MSKLGLEFGGIHQATVEEVGGGGTGDGLAGWWHHLSHGRAVPEGVKSSREQRRRTIPVEEEGRRSPAEEVYAVVEEATQGSCTHPNARRIAC